MVAVCGSCACEASAGTSWFWIHAVLHVKNCSNVFELKYTPLQRDSLSRYSTVEKKETLLLQRCPVFTLNLRAVWTMKRLLFKAYTFLWKTLGMPSWSKRRLDCPTNSLWKSSTRRQKKVCNLRGEDTTHDTHTHILLKNIVGENCGLVSWSASSFSVRWWHGDDTPEHLRDCESRASYKCAKATQNPVSSTINPTHNT